MFSGDLNAPNTFAECGKWKKKSIKSISNENESKSKNLHCLYEIVLADVLETVAAERNRIALYLHFWQI